MKLLTIERAAEVYNDAYENTVQNRDIGLPLGQAIMGVLAKRSPDLFYDMIDSEDNLTYVTEDLAAAEIFWQEYVEPEKGEDKPLWCDSPLAKTMIEELTEELDIPCYIHDVVQNLLEDIQCLKEDK